MSVGTNLRVARQSRPKVESLEERALLSTVATATTTGLKQFDYTSPTGGHVAIRLYGSGTLTGSNVDSNGVLDLEFSGTNEQTGIIGTVVGGDGRAPIKLLKHSGLPVTSLSGIGSSLVNVVNLKDFDLVDGGQVNLTGGVHILFLNSIGSTTQVHIREIPPSLLTGTSTSSTTENGVTLGFLIDNAAARTLTNVGGQFITGTTLFPVVPTSPNSIVKAPGALPAPAGVVVTINHINGTARATQGLGNPRVFGYDAKTNTLTRYMLNADPTSGVLASSSVTGQPDTSFAPIQNAIPGGGNPNAGVTLGRANNKLVVLLNDGKNIYAYNPDTGAFLGQFSLSTPSMNAIFPLSNDPTKIPSHIGTFDSFTVIGSSNGGSNGLGTLVAIDVTASLAKKSAVILQVPGTSPTDTKSYNSTREFGFSGGFAGIPGTSTLYSAGGAFFDPFQPNRTMLGVASLSPGSSAGTVSFKESTRTALTGTTPPSTNTYSSLHGGTPDPGPVTNLSNAFANVDLNLSLVTGFSAAQKANTISLYNPSSFAKDGSVTLSNTPNMLTSLTGTFRPDIAGTALVDINGNTQSFRANDATGLVFNDTGNANLVKIHTAADSTIIGYPFAHAQIPFRQNVLIASTARPPGTRNGVTLLPSSAQPTGPLSQPLE